MDFGTNGNGASLSGALVLVLGLVLGKAASRGRERSKTRFRRDPRRSPCPREVALRKRHSGQTAFDQMSARRYGFHSAAPPRRNHQSPKRMNIALPASIALVAALFATPAFSAPPAKPPPPPPAPTPLEKQVP